MGNKLKREKRIFYWLFIIVLLVAVFLRFYNFNVNSIIWSGDQAWDLIVARNILYNNHRPLVGPILWIPNFHTPPTYYYLLAFLLLIGKSPVGTTLLFQFMNIISLIVLFLLIKELLDNWAGLIGVLLFATSREMVYQSRVMWQPYPITLFIILALYFLVLAFKKRKMLFLWVSYTSYFIALSIYPGLVVLAPYFFWQMTRFRRSIKNTKSIRLFNATAIACLVSLLLIYTPQIYFEFQNNFPTLETIIVPKIDDLVNNTGTHRLSIYLENIKVLFGNFFRISSLTTYLIFIFFALLFLGLKNFSILSSKLAKKYEFSSQIIALEWLIVGSFAFLWFRMDVHAHRSLAYMPFMFIILAYLFRIALDLKNIYYKVATLLILSITIIANIKQVWGYINYSPLWLPTTNQVVDYIISDINKANLKVTDTTTFLISPGDLYGTDLYPILYELQERVDYPVNFVKEGNDVDRGALIRTKKPTLYLVCRDYKSAKEAKELCLDRFLKINTAYLPIFYGDLNFRFKIFKLVLLSGEYEYFKI